jgi:hypothetical protein
LQQRVGGIGETVRDLDIERTEFIERNASVALCEFDNATA